MSIDLDWHRLDASLAEKLVDALNRTLAGTSRPSFIGPVEITSFDFGSAPPDVELVDMRSIYRDFLDADSDSDSDSGGSVSSSLSGARKHTQGGASAGVYGNGHGEGEEDECEDDDGFEWVSRRAARRGLVEDGYPYAHLPPYVRYNPYGAGGDMFASTPSLPWSSGALGMGMGMGMGINMNMSVPSLCDFRPSVAPPRPSPASATATMGTAGLFRGASTPSLASQSAARAGGGLHPAFASSVSPTHIDSHTPSDPLSQDPSASSSIPPPPDPNPNPNTPAPHPNLQLHLYLTWHSNLRLTLSTSLLINYPSPAFMALPIKLAVTGLVFRGELAVAYEGARRRVHVCILDDLDPYAPACRRPSASQASAQRTSAGGAAGGGGLNSTKSSSGDLSASIASLTGLGRPATAADGVDAAGGDVDAATPPEIDEPLGGGSGSGGAGSSGGRRDGKPAPVGQRLLPSIFIESEIGQADKHVLKNVTRVERFIQDVIRKTVEEELVFPNFHTLVLGDQS